YDVPGYFLTTTDQAIEIIDAVSLSNLKLMFDCYHVQLMEGNLTNRLRSLFPYIGHIQFASVPSREAPNLGEIDYINLFSNIKAMGWTQPLGAEYQTNGKTEETLHWLNDAKFL
ncbi:MAG: TIM barrel protein, partial [Paracoccaceae bacterium]|nr:TIM barrel protein [Paracoccaceae bacterium]